ncbi:MAG: hypothetical protein AB7J40_04925 [Candidatus Altimarinota bacterium]
MKKILPLLIVAAVVITAVALYSNGSLQTQLLNEQNQPSTTQQQPRTVDECKKLSERLASDCIRGIAVREQNSTICLQITRRSDRARCQREVELSQ